MTEMENQRNVLIDILKGYAILLVVVGHAIQYNLHGHFNENLVFRFIYSFHMPFFMFLSGYINFSSFDGSSGKLYKRFKTTMIPFWSWYLFSFIFSWFLYFTNRSSQPDLTKAIIDVLKYPDNGLWFLWALFLNLFVLYLSLKISKKHEGIFLILFYILLNNIIPRSGFAYLGIGSLSKLLLFFTLGYLFSKHYNKIKPLVANLGNIAIVCFPVLLIFWSRGGNPTFSGNIPLSEFPKSLLIHAYNFVVPMSGILATYRIFEILIAYNFRFIKSLNKLGKISLEIYCTHFYFLNFIFLIASFQIELRIVITFIITLTGTLFIQWLIKKSELLAFIFYGKAFKNPKKATSID